MDITENFLILGKTPERYDQICTLGLHVNYLFFFLYLTEILIFWVVF